MQNSSLKNRPLNYKPLNFSKADIHSFVHGNPSQAISVRVPTNYEKPNISSLFDRYNRCNLCLRDCDQQDLNLVSKNIVIHEEPISQ